MLPFILLAQAAAPAAAPAGPVSDVSPPVIPQGLGLILLLGAWLAIVYFVGIRPGRKQTAARKAMLDAIKKNDKVVTSAGILGVVMQVKDEEVVLRVDDSNGTKLRFTRDAIVGVVSEGEASESSNKE